LLHGSIFASSAILELATAVWTLLILQVLQFFGKSHTSPRGEKVFKATFSFGGTVGFLAYPASPRPYGRNDIELSQINGEAIRRTVKPEEDENGDRNERQRWDATAGHSWEGGFQGGAAHLAYLALRSKDIVSYHVYIRARDDAVVKKYKMRYNMSKGG